MKDLALTKDGDLEIETFDLQIVEGRDQVAQRLKTRLKTWLGEWFLDTDWGVPYLESILVKNPDFTRVNAVLTQQILLDAEITEIVQGSLATSFDNKLRKFSYSARVMSVFGTFPVSDNLEI